MTKNLIFVALTAFLTLLSFNSDKKVESSRPIAYTEVVKTDTIIDTVYLEKIVELEPEIVYHQYDTTIYSVGPDYDLLLEDFADLGNQLYSTNTFDTTFVIDSIGSVTIQNVVEGNQIIQSNIVFKPRSSNK